MLADKFHPFRVSAVFLFLYGVAALWSGFYIHDTRTFLIGFMLHGIFATSYNTAAATMGNRLLARSRFLILAAGQGIVGTVISMIVTPLLGLFLDWTGSEYRYSYLVGAAYVLLGVPLYIIVYRKFKALAGRTTTWRPTRRGRAGAVQHGHARPSRARSPNRSIISHCALRASHFSVQRSLLAPPRSAFPQLPVDVYRRTPTRHTCKHPTRNTTPVSGAAHCTHTGVPNNTSARPKIACAGM